VRKRIEIPQAHEGTRSHEKTQQPLGLLCSESGGGGNKRR
jgi:hypothetical protein